MVNGNFTDYVRLDGWMDGFFRFVSFRLGRALQSATRRERLIDDDARRGEEEEDGDV